MTTSECVEPSFYVLATSEEPDRDRVQGWTACVSHVPCRHPLFASIKSTSQLDYAYAKIDAEQRGFDLVGAGAGAGAGLGRGGAGGGGRRDGLSF